jgi:GxxExxY protein
MEMKLQYKGRYVGKRRVDFFIENCVMLEIKAVTELLGAHKTQAINYCEAST